MAVGSTNIKWLGAHFDFNIDQSHKTKLTRENDAENWIVRDVWHILHQLQRPDTVQRVDRW
jgi:hypothetical protein